MDLEGWRRQLYDDAAFYITEGDMTWSEFWRTPKHRLRMFLAALQRKWAREKREAERRK